MFRDFIYLDIDRIQSIIAQLQQGLLTDVMEGKMEQTTGRAEMAMNLLAMLLPVSTSGSLEHGRGTSISESRVLHDYAFEAARLSLEDGGFLVEQDGLDWDEVPETGFVLVRGAAQILDFETLKNMAESYDRLDQVFHPPSTPTQRKKQKNSEINRTMRDIGVVIDAFYKDAIRVKIVNARGTGFIGPLAREHLREDIRGLIYKHGSNPRGEWAMLAEISRVPLPGESPEEIVEDTEEVPEDAVSNLFDHMIGRLNELQATIGSAAFPDIAVSPVAVYREINPGSGT